MAIISDEKNGDIRIRRNRAKFREAYLKLCNKMSPKDITINNLTEIIGVNRATFRHHYDTMNDLMLDVEQNIFEEIKNSIDSSDTSETGLSNSIYVIYRVLYKYGDPMITLLFNPDYFEFANKFKKDVLGMEYFRSFYNASDTIPSFVIEGFFSCIFSIYYSWYNSAVPELSLDQLAEECANKILHGGLSNVQTKPKIIIPKCLKAIREEYQISADTIAEGIGLSPVEYICYEKDNSEGEYTLPDEYVIGILEFFKSHEQIPTENTEESDIPDWVFFCLEYLLYKYKDKETIPEEIKANMLAHEALDSAEKAVMSYTLNREGKITEKWQLANRLIRSADRIKKTILSERTHKASGIITKG